MSVAIETTDILGGLRLLCDPQGVHELRVPRAGRSGVISGYFSDLEAMAQAAGRLSGHAAGIYFTINPVDPALLARAQNRVQERAELTTSDDAISSRRWLVLDLDPVRPAGISASPEEHEAAIERARQIMGALLLQGWPQPCVMDSGNGCYLLYRIELPNSEKSRRLLERCLEALALHHNDERVKVDQTMFNAARIIRVPGTLNAKGDNTAERSHRPARVLYAPEPVELVSPELLEALALPEEEVIPTEQRRFFGGRDYDLEDFVKRHLQVAREGPWGASGYRWVLRACPFNSEHTDLSAWVARRDSGAFVAGCQHNSCHWKWRDLRAKYDPPNLGAVPSNGHREEPQAAFAYPAAISKPLNEAELTITPIPAGPAWPEDLGGAAFHGLAGHLTQLISPYVESNDAAVLVQFLAAFGTAVGLHPHRMVGATRHAPVSYVGLVGPTSMGRKGTAWDPVEVLFKAADPDFFRRIFSGLGSGERLVWLVRDPTIDAKGAISDPGAPDRRLLIQEPELGRLLTVVNREGSTLSAYLRSAYDGKPLRNEVKSQGSIATLHHIGLIGHCTIEELREELSEQQVRNGLANRILWVLAKRAKKLYDPPIFEGLNIEEAIVELATVLGQARGIQRLKTSPEANSLWKEWYLNLPEETGVTGAIMARAATQVVRFSMIYALTDVSEVIDHHHLQAAITLWDHSVNCVRHIWGSQSGDVVADRIYEEAGYGPLTITQLYREVFAGNITGVVMERAIKLLEARGLVVRERATTPGRGRPAIRVRRIN